MRLANMLDPWLYRHPFEGASARRYATVERPGFGDLDDRLIARWRPELAGARRFLDLGAGPGTFTARLAAGFPDLEIIAVEPSRDFVAGCAARPWQTVRARAEALPLADATIDVALCLSSLRHVGDRAAALRELRRVVRPGGTAFVVELDPAAPPIRARNHTRPIPSPLIRAAFAPLVLRTAPTSTAIAAAARAAGWATTTVDDDPVQPVYLMRLA